MEEISFTCPHCNVNLQAGKEFAGQVIECPNCSAQVIVPAPESPDELNESAPEPQVEEEKSADVSGEEAAEDMEAPSEQIMEGLNRISEALIQSDVQAIRGGSRELSAIADRYGMHTLADMARCFRAAWEEGDVEAAAQIVEEMRAEAARL